MAALRTHLLRAVYDWAVENGFTPHIVADTKAPGVRVPTGYADEAGRIVLNVHPHALQGFTFDDSWVRFSARWGAQRLKPLLRKRNSVALTKSALRSDIGIISVTTKS